MYTVDTNSLAETGYARSHSGVEISEIGRIAREARRRKGMNQVEFGALLGVNGQTISNLERGSTQALQKSESVRLLAEVSGHPLEELMAMNEVASTSPNNDVLIRLPRDVFAKVGPYAQAQGIDADKWIAAAIEALMRLQGSPKDAEVGKEGDGIHIQRQRRAAKKDKGEE